MKAATKKPSVAKPQAVHAEPAPETVHHKQPDNFIACVADLYEQKSILISYKEDESGRIMLEAETESPSELFELLEKDSTFHSVKAVNMRSSGKKFICTFELEGTSYGTESSYTESDQLKAAELLRSDMTYLAKAEMGISDFNIKLSGRETPTLFIKSMVIEPNGGYSTFKIDGGAIPAHGNFSDPSTWTYVGVTDGNSLRFSGDKTTGYEAMPENTTYGPNTKGNILSKINKQKGPYDGLKSMSFWNKSMRKWFPENGKPPVDMRQQVFSDANNLAVELNMQLQNNKEMTSLNRGISLNSLENTSSEENNICFTNIIFESSCIRYIGFNNFSGGCTK